MKDQLTKLPPLPPYATATQYDLWIRNMSGRWHRVSTHTTVEEAIAKGEGCTAPSITAFEVIQVQRTACKILRRIGTSA